jgi:hypothetical protein
VSETAIVAAAPHFYEPWLDVASFDMHAAPCHTQNMLAKHMKKHDDDNNHGSEPDKPTLYCCPDLHQWCIAPMQCPADDAIECTEW